MEDRFHFLIARKLSGAISAEEAQELEALVSMHPGLHLPLELLETMWAQERDLTSSPEAREAFVRHWLRYRDELNQLPEETVVGNTVPEVAVKSTRRSSYLRFIAVASFILLIPLFFLWKPFTSSTTKENTASLRRMETISTKMGMTRQVVLPDGSKIWLNAGSALSYDPVSFRKGNRVVNFHGEGYFDITHDKSRPFFVRSGNMQIRVLGTAFNVKAYPGEHNMETSLIRGSVEVRLDDRPDDVYILRPHEKLVVSQDEEKTSVPATHQQAQRSPDAAPMVSLKRVTLSDSGKFVEETAWVQNKLVFRSESFSSLAVKLERRYGVHIFFEDPEKGLLSFTGIFTTETVQQALEAMQLVHPFSFTLDKENIHIR